MPLSTVSGVYNAVEVLGEPVKNVMFYGPGAGAGPTASAVVGDLMEIMRSGNKYAVPVMTKSEGISDFSEFKSSSYIAMSGVCPACVKSAFGEVQYIEAEGECSFVTPVMTDGQTEAAIKALTDKGGVLKSRIRLL